MDRYFKSWDKGCQASAASAAEPAFSEIAREFTKRHASDIAQEESDLLAWVKERTREVCGEAEGVVQGDLFEQAGAPAVLPKWHSLPDSPDRLASFATDGSPVKARKEAEGVLKLYKDRSDRLHKRARLDPARLEPLGF